MKKQQQRKKTNQKKYLLIIAIVIAVALLCVNISFYHARPLYSKQIDISFEVGEKFGVIINETVLDFGILIPNSAIEKKVILKNEYTTPMQVEVTIDENLKDFVFGKATFTMQPNEEIVYPVNVRIPTDAELRTHQGFIRFDFFPLK